MQEKWERWEPISGLIGPYTIDTIVEGRHGLIITLHSANNTNQKVEVAFKPFADAHRRTNESFRIRLPYDLTDKYGREFYSGWTFFKITGSEYLSWLAHESCDFSKNFKFQHFCLATDDSILEVLARWEPEVKIISASKEA